MDRGCYFPVTTIVGVLTFLAVVWYAWEARRTANAAARQLEALQTPCLVPIARPQTSDDPDLKRAHESTYVFRVRIKNIGSGPALNAHYQLKKVKDQWEHDTLSVPCGPVAAGTFYEVPDLQENVLPMPAHFRLRYESLSGQGYETEATIIEQKRTVEVRFRRLGKP